VAVWDGDGLISGLGEPALEKVSNEIVGLDDDDAPAGRHENSLALHLATARRHVGDAAGASI
jgi:hypothetical protein